MLNEMRIETIAAWLGKFKAVYSQQLGSAQTVEGLMTVRAAVSRAQFLQVNEQTQSEAPETTRQAFVKYPNKETCKEG
jgi:hypothetical protein